VATEVLVRPRIWVPVVAGTAVTVALGVYGRAHEPAVVVVNTAAYLRLQVVKSWLTAVVGLFAMVQVLSALAIRLDIDRPWLRPLHRTSGRATLLLSLPIAVHCLYALGLHAIDGRIMLHALCGCVFYGAFVAKMLLLGQPGGRSSWAVPIAGGVAFAAVAGACLTSAVWFFSTVGATF